MGEFNRAPIPYRNNVIRMFKYVGNQFVIAPIPYRNNVIIFDLRC